MWTEKTKSLTINITISAIAGFLLLPIQLFLMMPIGVLITETPYLFFHNLFGFDWSAGGSIIIDVRLFFEFWFIGFGIYLLYFAIYFIVGVICYKLKGRFSNKLRIWIVGILLAPNLLFAFTGDIRRPLTFSLGLGYAIANAFLFTFIMFSLFALAGFLLDKHTKINEFVKVVLSLIVSVVVGFLLSGVVWLILFNIFN